MVEGTGEEWQTTGRSSRAVSVASGVSDGEISDSPWLYRRGFFGLISMKGKRAKENGERVS